MKDIFIDGEIIVIGSRILPMAATLKDMKELFPEEDFKIIKDYEKTWKGLENNGIHYYMIANQISKSSKMFGEYTSEDCLGSFTVFKDDDGTEKTMVFIREKIKDFNYFVKETIIANLGKELGFSYKEIKEIMEFKRQSTVAREDKKSIIFSRS